MQIATIGIDIAKHVFQVHAVSSDGEVVLQNRQTPFLIFSFF